MQIKTQGGEFTISGAAELSAWLEKERAFWEWLPDTREWQSRHYYTHQDSPWTGFITLFSYEWNPERVAAEEGEMVARRVEKLNERYADGSLIHSSSAEAAFVNGLRERDPEMAKHAMAYFLNGNVDVRDRAAVEGVVGAILFQRGVSSAAENERKAIKRLRNQWTNDLAREQDDWKARFESLITGFDELVQTRQKTLSDLASRSGAQLKKCEELRTRFLGEYSEIMASLSEDEAGRLSSFAASADETLRGAEKRFEDIAAAFREHMALKSPVEYWGENREFHEKMARRYFGWLRWIAPILVIGIGVSGWFLLGQERTPAWGKMIFFFVLTGLVVWGLRILVRLYLEHLRLQIDSHERIVMAKTYLALRSEGVSAGETETAIVFSTLFRPALAGAHQDEAVPSSAVELLGKLISPGK